MTDRPIRARRKRIQGQRCTTEALNGEQMYMNPIEVVDITAVARESLWNGSCVEKYCCKTPYANGKLLGVRQ